MKRIARCLLVFLILFSLVGCEKTNHLQEINENSASTTVVTIDPQTISTPLVFNVNEISMQATPESTCFSEIGYDLDWGVLVVRFRDSGSVYTYSDFPESEWNEFVTADSLGSWYNKYIKSQYVSERIS